MTRCLVGFGRSVITPQRPGASAGWSVVGPRQVGALAPGAADLVATAMAVSQPGGQPLVLVYADLHCGGTALWRALAEETDLPPERLILAGTHTHAGPGHIYGSVLYNTMTTGSPIPWPHRARSLARQIAPAVLQAVEGRVPGTVGLSRVAAWGVASNRAVPAVMRMALAEVGAYTRVGPGQGGPPQPLADQLRDPRVCVLTARDRTGRAFGAMATAAIHGTALGPRHPHWSADWAGPARRHAEGALGSVLVGLAGGASGDVSPLALDEEGRPRDAVTDRRQGVSQGPDLAEVVGLGVAEALVQAVRESEPGAFGLGVAHECWRPRDDPRLGWPTVGLATSAGGIDGFRSEEDWERFAGGVKGSGYAEHAAKALPPPHHPKIPIQHADGLGALPIAQVASRLGPSELPLHAVALGDVTVVTVPGEPTTFVGWRIERAVHEAVGGRVLLVGYAGDYAGYWVTPEAYDQQRYEGASTLFGREASTVLIERLVHLARRARYDSQAGTEQADPAGVS